MLGITAILELKRLLKESRDQSEAFAKAVEVMHETGNTRPLTQAYCKYIGMPEGQWARSLKGKADGSQIVGGGMGTVDGGEGSQGDRSTPGQGSDEQAGEQVC